MANKIATDIFHDAPEVPLRWARAMLTCLGNAYDDTGGRVEPLNTEMGVMSASTLSDALFGIQSLIDVATHMIEGDRSNG